MRSRSPSLQISTSTVATGAALNPDVARRDSLLELGAPSYEGGIERFADLDAERLKKLLDEGFLDPAGCQNESPSAWEFLLFLERWPQVRAHGYAVAPEERDYRVSIEGVECDLAEFPEENRAELREEFAWLCGDADQYINEEDYLYAWWD